jgi:electron transfer flavoprotein alpha subunit
VIIVLTNSSEQVPSFEQKRSVVVQVFASIDSKGEWSPVTFELLSDATVFARRLGGQVAAWMLATNASASIDTSSSELQSLADHGCRLVHRLNHHRFSSWGSEVVAAALSQCILPTCRVILLPGTARGEEVAALLAERLQTIWIPDVLTVSVTRQGSLEITSVEPGGRLSRSYRMITELPVVITIGPGVADPRRDDQSPEPELQNFDVDLTEIPELSLTGRYLPADPATIDVTFAERIVAGGRGTGGNEGMRLIAELAQALCASPAASRMAVDLGWAPPERQIGQTGKTVLPDLYVACGISGASHHLAGMSGSKHIVAINTDSTAPIHEVAHLSFTSDLHQLIPEVVALLANRGGKEQAGVSC